MAIENNWIWTGKQLFPRNRIAEVFGRKQMFGEQLPNAQLYTVFHFVAEIPTRSFDAINAKIIKFNPRPPNY